MSLQVWLPLTKDLRQQGLANVTITNNGATYSSTGGKLGGCYSFDGTNDRISCSSNTWTYPLSICAWFKPTDFTNSNTQYWLSYNTDSGGTAGHAIGIGTYGGVLSVWYGGTNTTISTSISNNNWYHITLTIDANKKAIAYLNGVQIWTTTFTSNNPGSKWFTLGARSNSATGGVGGALYFYKGSINDARLYNHCLSAMEVKEIAKGLVLHYPLSRNGLGQENLYIGTKDFSGSSWGNYSSWTTETDSYNGFTVKSKTAQWGGLCQNIPATNGDIFTISFWAKVESGGTLISIDRSNLGNVTTGLSIIGGNFTSGRDWVLSSQNATQWKYYWGTVQIISPDITYLQWRIENSVSNKKLSVCGFKLERGDKPTPWCPNSSDTLATTMGLNFTTEYDCSGFCNNGQQIGTLTYLSDTPRYSVSTYFNGSSYILTDSGTFSWFDFNKCTVSVWMKPTSTPSSWAGTFGIAHNNSAGNKSFVIGNYGGTFTVQSANGNWVNIQSSTLPINEWHHCVATLDGTTIKMYFDGELVNTYTTSWGSTTVASDTRVQVGIDLPGSDEIYQGYYSDARIYTTALSAEDVLELYHTAARIDNVGNTYVYQYIET